MLPYVAWLVLANALNLNLSLKNKSVSLLRHRPGWRTVLAGKESCKHLLTLRTLAEMV